MTKPSLDALYAAIDATWPAAGTLDVAGWRVRRGEGGGSRVSSAVAIVPEPDIGVLEAAHDSLGQIPLVMVRAGEDALDTRLAAAGFRVKDPVTLYICPTNELATAPPPVTAFHVAWPPMRIQTELWAEAGIGPERLAVMDRVNGPCISILGRSDDQPAGVAFVARHNGIAMLHALEVLPGLRRRGTARNIMHAAALWAKEQGAEWFAVLVTQANDEANALYASLGMEAVGQYHYRSR